MNWISKPNGKRLPISNIINHVVAEKLYSESSFWKYVPHILRPGKFILVKIVLRTPRQNIIRYRHLWEEHGTETGLDNTDAANSVVSG